MPETRKDFYSRQLNEEELISLQYKIDDNVIYIDGEGSIMRIKGFSVSNKYNGKEEICALVDPNEYEIPLRILTTPTKRRSDSLSNKSGLVLGLNENPESRK